MSTNPNALRHALVEHVQAILAALAIAADVFPEQNPAVQAAGHALTGWLQSTEVQTLLSFAESLEGRALVEAYEHGEPREHHDG